MTDDRLGQDGGVTGGCQCGAIRYRITGSSADWNCTVCHCRMCQKASGGPFMVFVNVARDKLAWTAGERASFASSSLATRGFCRDCGTPLTYERTPQRISIAHGTFDDPRMIDPTSSLAGESVLPWSEHVGTLPIEALAGWVSKLAAPIVSHQHPDRDR